MNNLKTINGLTFELINDIKLIEDILFQCDEDIFIMNNIWYNRYKNRDIILHKSKIYTTIAEYISDNNPDNVDELINSVKRLFEYFNEKMIMNKLINPEDKASEMINYKIDLLINPNHALEDIRLQILCLAC